MADQPHLEPLEKSTFFANDAASRQIPAGTVARGYRRTDEAFFQGTLDGKTVTKIPMRITAADLERGRGRFNIYCVVCHGYGGDGDGMIEQRGFPHPPSFHTARLEAAPVGHFYQVITNGYGAMFSYADRLEPADRWRIAAYIRTLQFSQDVLGKPVGRTTSTSVGAVGNAHPTGRETP
jgi:mono/diheme cytochrome c family protein